MTQDDISEPFARRVAAVLDPLDQLADKTNDGSALGLVAKLPEPEDGGA